MAMDLFFTASKAPEAQKAFADFVTLYGQAENPWSADIIVSLGGDGHTIQTIAECSLLYDKPVYGINYGHYGHLQDKNTKSDDLYNRINHAKRLTCKPLAIEVMDIFGNVETCFAVNEAQVCNHKRSQLIKLHVHFEDLHDDGQHEDMILWGDGLIVATSIGSGAYSFAAGGPLLTPYEDKIVVTPNNPWFLENFECDVLEPCSLLIKAQETAFRQADVWVDRNPILEEIDTVTIRMSEQKTYSLLFDPDTDFNKKNQDLLSRRPAFMSNNRF